MLVEVKKLRKKFLEARNYVLHNIFTIPEPSSIHDLDRWYNELDEKTRTGLIALSVERRLRYTPGSDDWTEKIKDLLEGNCWWEDLDLICPMNLWEILQEIRTEFTDPTDPRRGEKNIGGEING